MRSLSYKPVALFSMMAAVVMIPIALRLTLMNAAAYAVTPVPVLAPSHLPSTMVRAGLSAEALTAIGVTAQGVGPIVAAFEGALDAEPTRLSAGDAAYAEAKTESDRLRRLIESGRGSQADATAYKAEMQALEAAMAARESALEDFFAAATEGLSQAQVAALKRIRSNGSWEVPTQYKAVDRSEADWVTLKRALANERICAKYGDDTDPALMSFLSSTKANGTVSAAKASLDTNLASVKAAWKSAAYPE